jgi:hypothetical protein
MSYEFFCSMLPAFSPHCVTFASPFQAFAKKIKSRLDLSI